MEIMKITQLREIIREEIKSINELSASVIRNKLLKQFGDDPLYKDFIIAKTSKEQKKALATLKSIRGGNAIVLMQKYVKKLQGESVNESVKRQYWDAYAKYYKTYEAFATGVMDLAKSVSKISGDKTDERIILKNFTKQIIPFASLMRSWSKGHEKNPHIDEKIKVKIQNQTKSISEDIVRGNEVHAKTKKELKAAIARSMKEILNGKTPKYDIINGMSGEMIGWKDGNDYIWQPNAIPYAERELK
jgi:hypothetical protein